MLFPYYSIVFVCFLDAFPIVEYINSACFVIWIWSEGNISSPIRYSHLSILPDNNADSFAASLLMCYSVSSLIFSSTDMETFYMVSKRWCLECKGLSAGKGISLSK